MTPQVQDSYHLGRVLEWASQWLTSQSHGEIGANGESLADSTASIDEVATMHQRLAKAEVSERTILEIACEVLCDHGFKPQGIKHADDPEGMVTSTLTLNSDHLPDDAHKYLKALAKHDSRVRYAAGNSSTGDFTAMLAVGELPGDPPYALVEVNDIALMRGATYIHLTPEGPVFPGLKTY